MTRHTMIAATALAPLLLSPQLASADAGHHHHVASYSAGQPGDPSRPARIVHVTMRETDDGRMIYEPATLRVTRGEQIRFVLTNAGEVEHEFVLASTEDNLAHAAAMANNPSMAHEEPNGRMLQPKAKTELLWRFSKSGTFEFACLLPGHREAGMTGTVSVR